MLQVLSILNDSFRIPLSILQACNYTKAANLVPGGTALQVVNKGFGCQEFSVSFTLSNASIDDFIEVNDKLFNDAKNLSIEAILERLIAIKPQAINKDSKYDVQNPSHIFLAGECVCPELLFMLTSVTHTIRGDLTGRVLEADISMTLSGCAVSKQASVDPLLGNFTDVSEIPVPVMHIGDKSFECRELVNITQYELSPSTLTLQLDVQNIQNEISAFLIKPMEMDRHSYIEIPGQNRYYIRSANFDDPFITYECDVFEPSAYEVRSKTFFDTTLNNIIYWLNEKLNNSIVIHNGLGEIRVSHYQANANAIDTLTDLSENLGFLVALHESKIHLLEVPKEITASDDILFYTDSDVVSAKTCKVVYRDAEHQYTVGDNNADSVVINSPVCTSTDRSKALLQYYNLMENQLILSQPFDNQVRPMCMVNVYQGTTAIPVMITQYTIDLLSSVMQIECHYTHRNEQ